MSDRTLDDVQSAWRTSADGRTVEAWLWDEVVTARAERDAALARLARLREENERLEHSLVVAYSHKLKPKP